MAEENKYPYIPRAGLHQVGSYQVSGRPWMTGSLDIDAKEEKRVKFPYVCKSFTLVNRTDVDLRLHFAPTASVKSGNASRGYITGLHYVTLTDSKDKVTMNVKCKEVYVTSQGANGAFELYAELTTIPTASMYPLTGSGLSK